MKLKQIFGGVLLGLLLGSAMAQTTVTPLARLVSQWPVMPGTELRVYAGWCTVPVAYPSASIIQESVVGNGLYQWVLINRTGNILNFSCTVDQR